MKKVITASEANRQFSKVLREVSHGRSITVVSRGKAVASIAPVEAAAPHREAAKRKLLERLRRQKPSGGRAWSRAELYDR